MAQSDISTLQYVFIETKMRMKLVRILACITMAITLLLAAAGPWMLYYMGLAGVDGKPQPATIKLNQVEKTNVWNSYGGIGEPEFRTVNPYQLIGKFFRNDKSEFDNAEFQITAFIAADYVRQNRRHTTMIWWHLSTMATTIWISENWTSDQILDKAAELVREGRLKLSK